MRWGNCRHCGGSLPCKPCTRKRQQAWVQARRDRVRQQKLAYEARYPERVIESKRLWYERNKEAMRARQRALRKENPEARRVQSQQQYANDPTPFIVRKARREERDRQVGGNFTQLDQCALFQIQRGLCANPYCQADLSETGFHADHKVPVVLGGSHDPMNRQLLCPICNHRKGVMTNEEWLAVQEREQTRLA